MEYLDLNFADANAVSAASRKIADLPMSEVLKIRLSDVGICPNRVVPIVGLADCFRRSGKRVEFETTQDSAADLATSGYTCRDLKMKAGEPRPFGRVWRFDKNTDEQGIIVNAMVLALTKSARLAKGIKQGFEWCLNEVMDNVLNHSCPHGQASGYVMVQYLEDENRLKACVFDTGIGLFASFAGSRFSPVDSAEAIRLAVQRNVTNGNGQGNGLWGLHELVKLGRSGRLHIRTGNAEYLFEPSTGRENVRGCEPLSGYEGTTLVDFQIVCSDAASMEDVFGGPMYSADLWQERRELSDGAIDIRVTEVVPSFGSRQSAGEVRRLVENIIDADGKRVVVDFTGIETCSSSFVDELIGKLLERYGFAGFSERIGIRGLQGFTATLVEHSIGQRYAERSRREPLLIRDSGGDRVMGPTGAVGPEEVSPREPERETAKLGRAL